MKQLNKITYFISTAAIILFSGCLKDKVKLPAQNEQDYNQVYMPQAVSVPRNSTLPYQTGIQYLTYGANYGGTGYPQADIPVTFMVSPDSIDAYNKRYGTNYPILPANSYTLEQLSSIIPSGQLSTPPLRIALKTEGALEVFKEYLLPVSVHISGTPNGFKLSKTLATTYFLVKGTLNLNDFTDHNRAPWKVTYFSSQEENGEGPVNGRATTILDGDVNTYWHSRWANNFADPPHVLVIDMNETKTLHGISLVDRQNNTSGRPQRLTVETGNNGTDWLTSDVFSPTSTNDRQRYFFTSGFKNARFIRLTFTTMYDNARHTHLAEFNTF